MVLEFESAMGAKKVRSSIAKDIVVVGVEVGNPRSWLFTCKGKGHVRWENNWQCDKTTYAPPH